MSSTQVGSSAEVSVELTGDPELRQSIGKLTVRVEELGEEEDGDLGIALDIPDRFGFPTFYDFTHADWLRIREAVDRAAYLYFTGEVL